MMYLKPGSKWKGFYDAPLPYGRQEFTCEVEEVTEECRFVATGEDKDGKFTLKGCLPNINPSLMKEGQDNEDETYDISFVKDYLSEDGYKGVEYKGTLVGTKITGNYSFVWKKGFISKTVTGKFEMNFICS
jgi:hypothetical protein